MHWTVESVATATFLRYNVSQPARREENY